MTTAPGPGRPGQAGDAAQHDPQGPGGRHDDLTTCSAPRPPAAPVTGSAADPSGARSTILAGAPSAVAVSSPPGASVHPSAASTGPAPAPSAPSSATDRPEAPVGARPSSTSSSAASQGPAASGAAPSSAASPLPAPVDIRVYPVDDVRVYPLDDAPPSAASSPARSGAPAVPPPARPGGLPSQGPLDDRAAVQPAEPTGSPEVPRPRRPVDAGPAPVA